MIYFQQMESPERQIITLLLLIICGIHVVKRCRLSDEASHYIVLPSHCWRGSYLCSPVQNTRCGHAWLTQICRVPREPGAHSGLFPERSRGRSAEGHSCGELAQLRSALGDPPLCRPGKRCSCGVSLPRSPARTYTHKQARSKSQGT